VSKLKLGSHTEKTRLHCTHFQKHTGTVPRRKGEKETKTNKARSKKKEEEEKSLGENMVLLSV
jgi:hypothetical protein